MKYKVFWCKVNKYYTDEWLNSEYLSQKSWTFVASCVVTDKAKKKWLKFVKQELSELKTNDKIFISWCWAFEKWEENNNFYEVYPELKSFENQIEILWESPNENKKNWAKKEPKKLDFQSKIWNLKQIYTKKLHWLMVIMMILWLYRYIIDNIGCFKATCKTNFEWYFYM